MVPQNLLNRDQLANLKLSLSLLGRGFETGEPF